MLLWTESSRAVCPHLIQGMIGGIIEGFGGQGPGLEGRHLLLFLIQQCLNVFNHDLIVDTVRFQEDFDRLDTGEGHSNIDGDSRPDRVSPEVQLGRTGGGTIRGGRGANQGRKGESQRRGIGTRSPHKAGGDAGVPEQRKNGGSLGNGQSPVWSGNGRNGEALRGRGRQRKWGRGPGMPSDSQRRQDLNLGV